MKRLLIITTVLVHFFTTSCKKDEADPLPVLSKTDMLTNGPWQLTAAVSDEDGNGTYEIDDYVYFPECARDNRYTFQTNLLLELNEGATKCDPADEQTDFIDWNFANNETSLVIDNESFTITELTNSTLKIKQIYTGNVSSMITFTKR
jgi:hypothetical protein